jgi:hypothetical protein
MSNDFAKLKKKQFAFIYNSRSIRPLMEVVMVCEKKTKFDPWSKHIAIRLRLGEIDLLEWSDPTTSECAINYCLLPRNYNGQTCLVVTGNLGHAVYVWFHDGITLEQIATSNLEYFASKCEASETGLQYRKWNSTAASHGLLHHLEDIDDISENAEAIRDEIKAGEHCDSEHELGEWLHSADAEMLFGGDAWELADIGYLPHDRCALHLEGLRAALAWFESKNITTGIPINIKLKTKERVFVEHIEKHLTPDLVVCCKICDLNINEIYQKYLETKYK